MYNRKPHDNYQLRCGFGTHAFANQDDKHIFHFVNDMKIIYITKIKGFNRLLYYLRQNTVCLYLAYSFIYVVIHKTTSLN